ncbi:hypothetical protein NPIL_264781 [Nephila pilipes]|uniref:Uncharacterized protein n=1 Tax=Nephila pilipes TaxID=299642 RepID=A0A8X6NZQ7_NEPPI|nr:hypothetical protein NPIL_264781 [Nephila pilipes]
MGETPMIDPDSLSLMLPFFSPASFRICSGEDGDEEMKPDGMRVPLFAVGLGGNLFHKRGLARHGRQRLHEVSKVVRWQDENVIDLEWHFQKARKLEFVEWNTFG